MKRMMLFIGDALLLAAAGVCAAGLVAQSGVPVSLIAILVILQVVLIQFSGLSRWSFHHAHISELLVLVRAIILGSLVWGVVGDVGSGSVLSWRFTVAQCLCALVLVALFRFSVRIALAIRFKRKGDVRRVLIAGAGEAGDAIVRQMKREIAYGYVPVGFVDDDAKKKGVRIRGLTVLGDSSRIPAIVRERAVDEILIAMPSAQGAAVRRVLSFCEKTVAKVKILPGVWEIILGDAHLDQIRDVRPEDLLGRESVTIKLDAVRGTLADKTVMVTGACGSIGSELVRQLESFSVGQIVAIDRNENDMYFLKYRGTEDSAARRRVMPVLADITNKEKMRELFSVYRPQVLFHAAAYKHVPLMELFPDEALRNNIMATRVLIDLADEFGVERMTLISTDKAVAPKNVMGLTKRIAEILIQSKRSAKTGYSAVRFGNVLGSNGSIVPILKKQIRSGGPVTVTSKDAKRYFMTVTEAVQLILQSSAIAKGGEIFVLDMGEQVSIDDLARRMIRLMGHVPDQDVKVVYTGLRPGEKMEESLFEEREKFRSTEHEKIMVGSEPVTISYDQAVKAIDSMMSRVGRGKATTREVADALQAVIKDCCGE